MEEEMTEQKQSRFLRFPLEMADNGRLATVACDAEALIWTLQIACDLSPGDFSAIPEIANPAAGIDAGQHESTVDVGSAVAQRMQDLVSALGRQDWEVRSVADDDENSGASIEVVAPSWRLAIPIILRDSLVLELRSAIIHRK